MREDGSRIAALRDRLEGALKAVSPAAAIFSAGVERLPNTTLFALPGVKAETALIALDLDGIAVSSGSACSSGKVASSHVLAAMGVPAALAAGVIRVSLGHTTTQRDIDLFIGAWTKLSTGLCKAKGGLAA
jgi:cysteine desulfurase